MTLPRIPLGEISDFIRGVTFEGSEVSKIPLDRYIPVLRAGNLEEELNTQNDLIWVPQKRISKEQYFQVNDIAICMASGSINVLGKSAQLFQPFIGSVGAFCGIIRVKTADPFYVGYWFKSQEFMGWRNIQSKGINIQNLRPKEVQEIAIPLPPLDEQRRIAGILQKADRLRRLRRYARRLSDGYLQSVFLEKFGEPGRNPKGWPLEKLTNIVNINPPLDKTYSSDLEVSFVPMSSVDEISASILFHEKRIFREVTKGYTPFIEGDVLFAKITPCMENGKSTIASGLINKVGFGSTEFHVLRPTEKTVAEWILWLIRREEFRTLAANSFTGTAGQQRVPASFIEDYLVPLPPIEEQNRFTMIVQKHKSLSIRILESERQAEHLFQSLLQGSFSGEL